MPIFHVSACNPGLYAELDQKQFDHAVRNGKMVMVGGIDWEGGQPWVESTLKNAGFQYATVYWPVSGDPMIAVAFNRHGAAVTAITAFHESVHQSDGDEFLLTARFHQDTPPKYTESLAKASEPLAPLAPSAPTSVAEAPTTEQKTLQSVLTTPNVPETNPAKTGDSLPAPESDLAATEAQTGGLRVEAVSGTQTITRAQHRAARYDKPRAVKPSPPWPESWKYNSEDPTAYLTSLMRDVELEEERSPAGRVTHFNKEGSTVQFYARQYSPVDGKVIVQFTKPKSDEDDTTLAKYVELGSEEEAVARAEGYTPFVVDELPINFDDGLKDPRSCPIPMDIISHNAPHEDLYRRDIWTCLLAIAAEDKEIDGLTLGSSET